MEEDLNAATRALQHPWELPPAQLLTTPSLHSLPLELILLIFELGPLKVGDAMMLRSLCTRLFDITESRTFWLCVARHHERDCLFPIPPSYPRDSMTMEELKIACFRAHSTIHNIASTRPEYKNHHTFSLPYSTKPIAHIQFLPGGRYVIVAHLDGIVTLCDLHAENGDVLAPDPTLSDSAHQQPKRFGKCLTSYTTASPIHMIEFATSGNRGEVVTIVTYGSWSYAATIQVVSITFIGPDQVEVESLFQTNGASDRTDAIAISDSLVAIVSDQLLNGRTMQLMLIDYRTGRFIDVRTTIDDMEEPEYNVLITQDGHVLLCKCTTSGLVVTAYFDVWTTLFGLVEFTDEMDLPVVMVIPPHSSIRFPYASSFPDDRFWITFHQWPNTQDRSRVAIVTELKDPYYDPQEPFHQNMITMHWLDITEVIRLLKAPYPAPPTIYPFVNYFRYPQPPGATEGPIHRELIVFGSFVRWAVWCLEIGEERTLEILPLPGPFDDERVGGPQPLESLVRKLHIPSALGRISTLSFCDQTGLLAINFANEQAVHVFNY